MPLITVTKRGAYLHLYVVKKDSYLRYHPEVKEIPVYKRKLLWGFVPIKVKMGTETMVFPPYTDEMYIKGLYDCAVEKVLPSIFNYMKIPFSSMGVWQAFLLHVAEFIMHRTWHTCYNERTYIFDLDCLRHIRPMEVDLSRYYSDVELLPKVSLLNGHEATVRCCFWNDWSGLNQETAVAHLKNGVIHFEASQIDTLVRYRCNIMF